MSIMCEGIYTPEEKHGDVYVTKAYYCNVINLTNGKATIQLRNSDKTKKVPVTDLILFIG